MSFKTRSEYYHEDSEEGNWKGYCEIQGDQDTHEDRAGATIRIDIWDDNGHQAHFRYFFFENDQGGLENIPLPVDPVTAFSICVGYVVGDTILRAALECWTVSANTKSGWTGFFSCMRQKSLGLNLRFLWRAFKCARKLVGPLGDIPLP